MLFDSPPLELAPEVFLLRSFVETPPLLSEIHRIAQRAAFRQFALSGGKTMAAAMSNCGALGWTSNAHGYAYKTHDPDTGLAWPAMPKVFQTLAASAAAAAGWPSFAPDSCLINRYAPGAGMGLHQDRDERDLSAPIVSVSIGTTCKFMLGGMRRSDPVQSVELRDGDVLVWGGASRLVFHGVRPLPLKSDAPRYNLTFRTAG